MKAEDIHNLFRNACVNYTGNYEITPGQAQAIVGIIEKIILTERFTVVDWKRDSSDMLKEFDAIYDDYKLTFGRTPDALMVQQMARVKLRLTDWWAHHREAIREALVLAQAAPQQYQLYAENGEPRSTVWARSDTEAIAKQRAMWPNVDFGNITAKLKE